MPCDQINIFGANLDNLPNWDRLEGVAKELGFSVYRSATAMTLSKYDMNVRLTKGGRAQVSGAFINQNDVAELKSDLTKGYTKSAVKAAAKKWGWNMTSQKSGKIRLKKRS